MAMSRELEALVAAAAPLWAGEAEVVRSYFDSPARTRETDLAWLRRQCKKEFWDSIHIMDTDQGVFLGPLEMLREGFPRLEAGVDRHEMLELAEMLYEEFRHYVAFADVYDRLAGADGPGLDIHAARADAEWPENEALGRLRKRHREQHGAIGARACRFTEGGYCTLFREGIARAGKGGIDDAIAEACRVVFDDEAGHMMKGIVGLDEEGLSPEDWALLTRLTVEQLEARIRMRNAQFGHPLSEARIAEILAGRIEPLPFDFLEAAAA